MSHEVETMAWTNEVPWHGLGVQVDPNLSTDQMLRAAQLDWIVEKRPMFFRGVPNVEFDTSKEQHIYPASNPVPDQFALVRNSDSKVLDVCGKEYTPIQNHEAFEFFREFVEAGQATMETAGSLRGGNMVWVLANLGKSFKLKGQDEVKGYLLMAQPHQQGKATLIKGTSVRVVCNNTLGFSLAKGNEGKGFVRRAHRGLFDDAAREAAKQQLGIAREGFSEFAENALKLSNRRVDELKGCQLLAEIFGDDELVNEPAVTVIKKDCSKSTSIAIQALEHAPGHGLASAQGTLWGLLNAVTYTTDHLIRRSPDSRVYNAWFGRSENLKAKAVEVLMPLA